MYFLITLVVLNLAFLAFLQLAYLTVSRRRLKISLLVDHLAILAKHGFPIHAGLRAIARDLGGFFGSRVARAAQRLEEGKTLGAAFGESSRSFPPLLIGMLDLGERSGNLGGFLEEMRRSYQRIAELPFQAMYLFVYPLLVSVGINITLAGLYAGIIPKFQTIMIQMGLPSDPMMAWWPRLIAANEIVMILCILLVVYMASGGATVHFGSAWFRRLHRLTDRAALALPVLGAMIRDGATQQFSMAVGLYLRSGAALPDALRTAASAERNGVLRARLERLAAAVGEGARFSSAAREAGFGGGDLHWFLETGEAAGLLSDHLLLAAVHYEMRTRVSARLLARGVVPLFVLGNGLIVAGTFFLIMLPLRQCLESIVRRVS